jgi:hypothetical protein
MRLHFLDLERIKRKAKDNVENGLARIKRWWTKRYQLPSNHELFTSQSIAELNMEMFEDMIIRKSEIEKEIPSAAGNHYNDLRDELNEIEKSLKSDDSESAPTSDPLIDEWERDLEAGKVPDLEKGMNRG